MEDYPYNLIILQQTGDDLIEPFLQVMKNNLVRRCSGGHFTNGTYVGPSEEVVPTLLTQAQFIMEEMDSGEKNTALVVAINSTESVKENIKLLEKKGETEKAERLHAEKNQLMRAEKVAIPLALQRPDELVVVVFYDEPTPDKLYKALKKSGFGMRTLFKWGYGTKLGAPIVVGAEYFEKGAIVSPLPNDAAPICANVTPMKGQKGKTTVVNLRGTHISIDNECLFTLCDPSVRIYGPRPETAKVSILQGPSFL